MKILSSKGDKIRKRNEYLLKCTEEKEAEEFSHMILTKKFIYQGCKLTKLAMNNSNIYSIKKDLIKIYEERV